ncbi:MAG: hypothetical protein V7635_609 [Arthrobacter sp.]
MLPVGRRLGLHAGPFGDPKEHAGRFPQGTTVPRGTGITYVAAAVPIILLGVKSFTGLVLDISIGLPAALAY